MSGRRSRSKGARTERGIVRALQANGIAAARVPLSGAVGGRFAGDIILPLMGRDLCVEVKARADGFRELYSWLDGRDVLIVKADRREPLCRCAAISGCRNCQAGKFSAVFRQRERGTKMSRPIILVGCWPRRMTADLAATYCGEPSASAFLERVGSEYPRPRVSEGHRRLWLKDDLDQALLPPDLAGARDLADDL